MILILYIVTVLLVFLCILIFFKTKDLYEQGRPLTKSVSVGWLFIDTLDILIIVFSSIYGIWRLPLDRDIGIVVGLPMVSLGVGFLAAGMIEFNSINMVLGVDASRLVTSGIYKWSRNPQFLGWYLLDLGIAILGISGFALMVAIMTIMLCHYYIVKLEEPYLERIFKEEYRDYKRRVARYIGLPRR